MCVATIYFKCPPLGGMKKGWTFEECPIQPYVKTCELQLPPPKLFSILTGWRLCGCYVFIRLYYMGSFLSLLKPKKKRHLTTPEIIEFLKDLHDQIIFDMLDNQTLLNKYKLRHIQQLIRLYEINESD